MLTPGLKKTRENQQAGSLLSGFTLFGGGKYRLAARKMRVLEESKLNRLRPNALKNFSHDIPAKFQGVKHLIHFKPASYRESSIWSEINRVLPNQAGSRPEIPSRPGELRPGSIIQKMLMTPQPGQSVESFREQLQQLGPSATRQRPPQKPRLDPGSRLFSRVQEISGQAQPPEGSIPERLETRAEPTAPELKPTLSSRDTIQRQAESLPPQKPAETARDQRAGLPGKPVEGAEIEPSAPVEPPIPAEVREPAEGPETRGAPPPSTQPGYLARPIKAPPQAGPVLRALPKARPASRPETTLPSAIPPAISSRPATASVAQRQPDTTAKTPTSKPKPTPSVPERPPTIQRQRPLPPQKVDAGLQADSETAALPESRMDSTESIQTPSPRPTIPTRTEAGPVRTKEVPAVPHRIPTTEPDLIPAAVEDQAPAPLEMPLAKAIESRVQTGKAIKALEPEIMTPRRKLPITPKSEGLLDLVAKYQLKRAPEDRPPGRVSISPSEFETLVRERAALKFADADFKVPQPIQEESAGGTLPTLGEPLPMSLAQMPQTERPSPASRQPFQSTTVETSPQVIQPRPQVVPESAPRATSAVQTTQTPTVQRLPDEPAVTSPVETVRRIEEPEEGGELTSPDLDQLAEDVLPYVKRILEIEAERLSNQFR